MVDFFLCLMYLFDVWIIFFSFAFLSTFFVVDVTVERLFYSVFPVLHFIPLIKHNKYIFKKRKKEQEQVV